MKRLSTPVEILNAALEKEHDARDFYEKLAAQSRTDFVRDLLHHLQNEEEKHADLIRKMLSRLEAGHSPS